MNFWAWVATLGSSTGALGLMLKAFLDRGKIKVDVAAGLSENAIAQVASMRIDLDAAQEDIKKFRAALRQHEIWDRQVIKKLDQAGIEVDQPPELWVL